MVPTMRRTNLMVSLLVVTGLLTACGSQPPRSSEPPVSPTPETTEIRGYETGVVVGERLRDAWETTKEFGRGLRSGFGSGGLIRDVVNVVTPAPVGTPGRKHCLDLLVEVGIQVAENFIHGFPRL